MLNPSDAARMAMYDHPERSWESCTVRDPDPDLATPPDPDAVEFVRAELDYSNCIGHNTFVRCPVCNRSIEYVEPHVRVAIRWDRDISQSDTVMICDRDCFQAWCDRGE